MRAWEKFLPHAMKIPVPAPAYPLCANCRNTIGCEAAVMLAYESTDWGHGFKSVRVRVAVCRACWKGEVPKQDPAALSRTALKSKVLGALSYRTSKRTAVLAAEAGLLNTSYLAEFLYDLDDQGEVVRTKEGIEGNQHTAWRLASS